MTPPFYRVERRELARARGYILPNTIGMDSPRIFPQMRGLHDKGGEQVAKVGVGGVGGGLRSLTVYCDNS